MIALPVIFRVSLNPLQASNSPTCSDHDGYMLVSAAVVVTVGRIGDMFGRVNMYNLGFAWFTVGRSFCRSFEHGLERALELVILRCSRPSVGHSHGELGSYHHRRLPSEQLGLALGMNMVAAILGSSGHPRRRLLSQVAGVGCSSRTCGRVFGTVWAYLKLKEIGVRIKAKIDWLGNLSFAAASR